MNQALIETPDTLQYFLKSRVHDLPDCQFRGYVEIKVRMGRDLIDSRLRYCPLIRNTWEEAVSDAERMAQSIHSTECQDGACYIFSSRTASSFESLMNMLSAGTAPSVV